ncbi:DUF5302 domain-containing protein [Arthrobacter sp. 35W]|uniref:DUF5302 domain-containing protein n=1 Tax=Arthrobacter sp. 35W TaxID=1132441 RepID=UPI00040B6692|nr:DUF5302 domain-containing protein [Arthrobacter sp. 35W]
MTSSDKHHNGDSAAPADTTASEEMKAKFREALDRKSHQHHATVEAATGAKINHQHGSESQKREFRRKSG